MSYDNYYESASTMADTIIANAKPSPETSGTYRRGLGSRSTDVQKSRLKAAAEQGIQMASAGEPTQGDFAARYIASLRGVDVSGAMSGSAGAGASGSGESVGIDMSLEGAAALQQLADKTEGGADYNTLFSFVNTKGKPFEGVRVSNMTLGDLYKFSSTSGQYGQYVKAKNKGVLATPMGRYQFVGSTLQSVAKDMGLSADTVFSPEVQDKMFIFHARQVLSQGNTPAEKRRRLRKTWVGFNNVSDEELDYAINQITLSQRPMPNPNRGT